MRECDKCGDFCDNDCERYTFAAMMTIYGILGVFIVTFWTAVYNFVWN